jgi:predicted metal-dependent phosphoesterase TrpH
VRIREQGGVVYVPHPFDGSRSGSESLLDELEDLIDVVEVHNARCFPSSLNARALAWAKAHGKLVGAGSDAHTIAELGRGAVELPEFENNRESFLDSLARGRVASDCVNSSPLFRLASTWAKIRKAARPAPRA